MDTITNALDRAGSYLSTMGISDFIDILIVALLIYWTIGIVRKSNFINLAKGVIMLLIALWVSELFGLIMIKYILRRVVELGVIALVIIFQPELRRALERVGSSLNTIRGGSVDTMKDCIEQTVQACVDFSEGKEPTGALIVFERRISLSPTISTGTVINADTSAELLENLFFKNTPLHDGAVIIRDGRIAAAGCMLPLSQRTNLSKEFGMRHKAGLGMSEQSDALIVIVSEETRAISVALNKEDLIRHLTGDELREVLTKNLIPEQKPDNRTGVKKRLKDFFAGGEGDNEA